MKRLMTAVSLLMLTTGKGASAADFLPLAPGDQSTITNSGSNE